jgi:hypothetical protein
MNMGKAGRPKGTTKRKIMIKQRKPKRNRPEMHTKEELIKYLDNTGGLESPFIEELWNKSVELAKKDVENGRKTVEVTTTTADGNSITKKKHSGFWSDNPVTWYFKQSGLPQWRKAGAKIAEEKAQLSDSQQKILSSAFDNFEFNLEDENKVNDEEDEEIVNEPEIYSDEIASWINLFTPEERAYLKKRYAHYYDTYEINEGADKLSLKRVLSLEIACHRIDLRRALNQSINVKEEEVLSKQLRETLESLKWTKKQRSAREDMAQNKFTVWIQDVSKSEHFEPIKKSYEKDEIDYLLETYIDSAREIMS